MLVGEDAEKGDEVPRDALVVGEGVEAACDGLREFLAVLLAERACE